MICIFFSNIQFILMELILATWCSPKCSRRWWTRWLRTSSAVTVECWLHWGQLAPARLIQFSVVPGSLVWFLWHSNGFSSPLKGVTPSPQGDLGSPKSINETFDIELCIYFYRYKIFAGDFTYRFLKYVLSEAKPRGYVI